MIEFVVTEDITKEFGLHNHTGHYVISFITKGKATVFYNNVSVVLANGDTFIIRPYMPHSVAVENGSQILSMCIKKDLFCILHGKIMFLKPFLQKIYVNKH